MLGDAQHMREQVPIVKSEDFEPVFEAVLDAREVLKKKGKFAKFLSVGVQPEHPFQRGARLREHRGTGIDANRVEHGVDVLKKDAVQAGMLLDQIFALVVMAALGDL